MTSIHPENLVEGRLYYVVVARGRRILVRFRRLLLGPTLRGEFVMLHHGDQIPGKMVANLAKIEVWAA